MTPNALLILRKTKQNEIKQLVPELIILKLILYCQKFLLLPLGNLRTLLEKCTLVHFSDSMMILDIFYILTQILEIHYSCIVFSNLNIVCKLKSQYFFNLPTQKRLPNVASFPIWVWQVHT